MLYNQIAGCFDADFHTRLLASCFTSSKDLYRPSVGLLIDIFSCLFCDVVRVIPDDSFVNPKDVGC